MGRVMFGGGKPDMVAPVTDILLSSIAEGSIVKLNENGNPVEFYVAKHDYESALNGTGRTLIVRKDCYDSRVCHSSDVNAYATSDINSWLNSTYKSLLDDGVQTAIDMTKFYYTPGNGTTSVTTLKRSIFLLSATELGKSANNCNTEGTVLPISNILDIAYRDGTKYYQWTRTPYRDKVNYVFLVNPSGGLNGSLCKYTFGSRPCFTLPSTAVFDKNTMFFKGAA